MGTHKGLSFPSNPFPANETNLLHPLFRGAAFSRNGSDMKIKLFLARIHIWGIVPAKSLPLLSVSN
jgi:hypothetical protein